MALAGYTLRLYGMDLAFDGIYRMFIIGECELVHSHLSVGLVKRAIYEISNLSVCYLLLSLIYHLNFQVAKLIFSYLKKIVREDIRKLSTSHIIRRPDLGTPTRKMQMTRKTLGTPIKVNIVYFVHLLLNE